MCLRLPNALRLKLFTLGAEYRIGGIERLLREIELEKIFGERTISMVRVADRSNTTLYLLAPAYWEASDIKVLKEKIGSGKEDLIRLEISENRDVLW